MVSRVPKLETICRKKTLFFHIQFYEGNWILGDGTEFRWKSIRILTMELFLLKFERWEFLQLSGWKKFDPLYIKRFFENHI